MSAITSPFATPAWWLTSAQLAVVTSVADPEQKGRVHVRLHGADPDGEALLWARVAVAFAGSNYGAFLLTGVGEEVVVVFSGGDVRYPIVIGALWTGANDLPEELSGDKVDRWTLTGKAGTRIAIVEENSGQEMVEITTPNTSTVTISEQNGGEITLKANGNTVKLSSSGVSVEAAAKVSVNASQVSVSASMVQVDAGISKFSGVVKCDTLIANSVVSSSYTPGAGNVW